MSAFCSLPSRRSTHIETPAPFHQLEKLVEVHAKGKPLGPCDPAFEVFRLSAVQVKVSEMMTLL
ncbi:hypothetical protein AO716_01585 [Arthrobacter sp. Edens01]|nr:hypothetical protein AO716_01585 [Arthrobacter sp. Edens01]